MQKKIYGKMISYEKLRGIVQNMEKWIDTNPKEKTEHANQVLQELKIELEHFFVRGGGNVDK